MKKIRLQTDVLIIGGGTAGCYAAITLARQSGWKVVIAEKANIRRSGCLAAGVNALNAYITEGHVPQDYVEYAKHDAAGIVREDLLLTMAERLNAVTKSLEDMGLVIQKGSDGNYVSRGWRNIKINGENIKPLLAEAVYPCDNITVLNHVNMTDLLTVETDSGKRVVGAVGFHVDEANLYEIQARAVLMATGGAAGLYRPNNPGFSRHKMWYSPFNTGAGYAMGLTAGAEMTTMEMRFIALRCKDTIAPTGTIAQGVHAPQINALGEVYENRYGLRTSERCYGTVMENREGRGPCYLRTVGITGAQEQELYKAYLNMAPSQTLAWLEAGQGPSQTNTEIEGTEPYIVGGHTASGYWVDTGRRTTLSGLYAAGDVAGGAPQKYVTGALAEGELAAQTIALDLRTQPEYGDISGLADQIEQEYNRFLTGDDYGFSLENLEAAMQKIMDEYAGGIRTDYQYNAERLRLADEKIRDLQALLPRLHAADMDDLLRIYELRERLTVCQDVIAHLLARKETRWHSFGENADYPESLPQWDCYVNSRMEHGEITIILRDLVSGRSYEHTN